MGIKGHVNRLVVLYFAPLSMDYSLELFELYLATCWTNLSDVLDYTYTCWAEAPKITPPQERSVQLLDAMRASCEIAAQAEQHLIMAKGREGMKDISPVLELAIPKFAPYCF